jgi:putative ABC transport system permease protein
LPMTRSFRHAARRLVHARGFTAAAVLTLALGIGGATTVFSVVNAVLLRPLPYPRADRLVSLSHTLVVSGVFRVDQSDATLLFYQRHSRAFTHLGGYQVAAANLGPVSGTDAERLPAARVTADVFPTLGVSPVQGRVFTHLDDRPGAPPVVVIAEQLWARKYGEDPGILNRPLDIDGVPHEVIGIMPAGVRFPTSDTALWLPMRLDPAKTESATFDYQAIARLRDGVAVEAAAADLQGLLPQLPDEFPGRMTRASIEQTHMRVSVRPLALVIVGDIGKLLWVALGAAGFVLAIACANVGNLFLVRAEGRRNAFAIQQALGAGRGVIFLECLSEGLLLAAFGGSSGLAGGLAGVRTFRSLASAVDIPRLAEVDIDAAVFGVSGLMTVFAALFVSALPALSSGGASMSAILSSTSRSATAGRQRQRARHALVVSQVALALILLVGSGLLARSVWRLRSVQPGFDPASAFTFRIALPPATYPDSAGSVRFFVRAVDGIASVAGVRAAGAVSKLPLDNQGRTDSAVFVEDRPIPPGALPGIHPVVYATPAYFEAAGIPFVAGRTFTRPDPPNVLLEAVVSVTFAEQYWNGASPIGRRVRIFSRGPWYTVVGVVAGIRDAGLDRPADPLVYFPLMPAREDPRWAPRDIAVVVRTARDPAGATGAVRDVMHGLDRSLPMYGVRPLTDVISHASARRSLAFVLIGCASGVALLLGAIGLYGVMSYVVTLRTHEIGVRLALGAEPGRVRRMVTRQGLASATLGIGVGLIGAMMLTRFLAALLFEVKPTDPVVLAAAATLLIGVAAAATWMPARRAAAIDPVRALKGD